MSEQPKALRLLEWHEIGRTRCACIFEQKTAFGPQDLIDQCGYHAHQSNELRRLHALCEEMGEALERIASRSMSMYAKREDMNSDLKRIAAEALAKWKESK